MSIFFIKMNLFSFVKYITLLFILIFNLHCSSDDIDFYYEISINGEKYNYIQGIVEYGGLPCATLIIYTNGVNILEIYAFNQDISRMICILNQIRKRGEKNEYSVIMPFMFC